jgi:hypothetical protein
LGQVRPITIGGLASQSSLHSLCGYIICSAHY